MHVPSNFKYDAVYLMIKWINNSDIYLSNFNILKNRFYSIISKFVLKILLYEIILLKIVLIIFF